jgi:hypothetical protein
MKLKNKIGFNSFVKTCFLILFLIIPSIMLSQKIYSVEYASQCDIKVFEVEYESECDLKVFKVEYESQVKGNEGLWYFVKYPSQSDKKIFFVEYESQSDLKIIFVKYKSQSGWRDQSKKHLLY